MARQVLSAKSVLGCMVHDCKRLTLLLQVPVTQNGVIDGHASQVVVLRIVGVDEGIRDIWDVVSAVAFPCDVDFLALGLEIIHEVLVESHELFCETRFVHDVRGPLRKSYAHRLFHPKHVGQVHPSIRVLRWGECPRLPGEGTVF